MPDRRSFIEGLVALGITSLSPVPLNASTPVEDHLLPLPLKNIRMGGYFGDRFEAVWRGNILKLDFEKDFLSYFRDKNPGRSVPGGSPIRTHNGRRRSPRPQAACSRHRCRCAGIGRLHRLQSAAESHTRTVGCSRAQLHRVRFGHGLPVVWQCLVSCHGAPRCRNFMVRGLAGKTPSAINDRDVHMPMMINARCSSSVG